MRMIMTCHLLRTKRAAFYNYDDTQLLQPFLAEFPFLIFSSVWINSWLPNDPSMPHEGWKNSGLGRSGGGYSMDFYTKIKTVSIKF